MISAMGMAAFTVWYFVLTETVKIVKTKVPKRRNKTETRGIGYKIALMILVSKFFEVFWTSTWK